MQANNFRSALGTWSAELKNLSAVAEELILSLAVATIARAGTKGSNVIMAEQAEPCRDQEAHIAADEARALINRQILVVSDRVSAQRRLVQRLASADDALDEYRLASDLLVVLETELEALNEELRRLDREPVHQA